MTSDHTYDVPRSSAAVRVWAAWRCLTSHPQRCRRRCTRFGRQVAHDGRGRAIIDPGVLELIDRMAGTTSGLRV
jgi:hypothetical protein